MFFNKSMANPSIDKAQLSNIITDVLRIIEEKCPLTIQSKSIFESEEEKKKRIELVSKMQVRFLIFAIYRCKVSIQLAHWNLIKLYLKLISLYVPKPEVRNSTNNITTPVTPNQSSPQLSPVSSSPISKAYVRISDEKMPLREYRSKLLEILERSNLYRTQEALDAIKEVNNNLIEERITILKKASPPKIQEAVHLISRPSFPFEISVRFCDEVFKNNIDKNVYNKLYEIYFQRRRAAKGPTEKLDASMKKLLNLRATRMQLDDVVKKIPKSFKVCDMSEFMKAATTHRINCLRLLKLRNALLEKTIQMKQMQIKKLHSGKVVVTSGLKCVICGKRIGESVFVALTDSTVAHLACKLSADS